MRGRFKDVVTQLAEKFPDRFYNLGICENTMISVAAGMASQGGLPFVHTIAPFLTERSFEQIKLDMSYNQFGGNIVTCGATFDYAWDGATHHAYADMAMLRLLPNTEVLQPGSEDELESLIRTQYANGKTTYFRLSDKPHNLDIKTEFGKGHVIKNTSSKVTVVTAGPILGNVLPACDGLDVNLIYFNTIKPIDKELLEQYRDTDILVVHDAHGLREAVNEVQGLRTYYHGLPDAFCGEYGQVEDIRAQIGLDVPGIKAFIETHLKSN